MKTSNLCRCQFTEYQWQSESAKNQLWIVTLNKELSSRSTAWCSNELIRETPKKFRVFIDPSQTVNKAIHRPKHQMPTLNEKLHKLSAAKCFSLADVKDGFLHIPLDEESSWMTTMHTSYSRYRWLRLPFGITRSPEEFQMRLTTALEGLEGIICIADDILVYGEGNNYEEAEKDHDRRFIALMEHCHKLNIKLNAAKIQFKLKELKFMGTIISDQGMKPDPDKVAAITQMQPPENKTALNPATVATTAYPTFAPNPLKRTEVHPQSEQQTPEQSNTTAEVTQEPTHKDPEPSAVSY